MAIFGPLVEEVTNAGVGVTFCEIDFDDGTDVGIGVLLLLESMDISSTLQ